MFSAVARGGTGGTDSAAPTGGLPAGRTGAGGAAGPQSGPLAPEPVEADAGPDPGSPFAPAVEDVLPTAVEVDGASAVGVPGRVAGRQVGFAADGTKSVLSSPLEGAELPSTPLPGLGESFPGPEGSEPCLPALA